MQDLEPVRSGKLTSWILILTTCCLLVACSAQVTEEDRQAVYNLIEWNLYYLRVEDLNGYMWTLDPEAPGYQETQSQTTLLFREFDLSYEIEEWEILSITPNAASIRVVQVTRKIAGTQPFLDNRVEAVHRLRKNREGEWKIYTTEINQDSVEYLY